MLLEKVLTNKESCCGCAACEDICPVGAVAMADDEYGYTFPVVDQEKCIHCRKCEKVCPLRRIDRVNIPNACYAAMLNDRRIESSSSGGIFYAIARKILEQNGAVFGCAYISKNDTIFPKHILVQSIQELPLLQGSKYAQSDTRMIYRKVREQLDEGKIVLFTGTPCQVEACIKYLGKPYENFYTIDIICHGVPSQSFFVEYIRYQQNKLNAIISNYIFRDKTIGWGLHGAVEFEKNNRQYRRSFRAGSSSYFFYFLNGETYRDSCYSCPFADQKRVGDITLGDYWGIEKEHPAYLVENGGRLNSTKGISCVLVNTEHGRKLLDVIENQIEIYPTEYEKIAAANHQLTRPSEMGKYRETIMNSYKNKGYAAVARQYQKSIGVKRWIYRIYNALPHQIQQSMDRFT